MIRDIIGTVSLVDVEDGSPVAVSVMDQKENTTRCEMKVAQDLLRSLPSLEGKTVTADPLHCQKDTARAIADKGGDYFLQIKGNQPSLLELARIKPAESPFLPRAPLGTDVWKPARSASPQPNPFPPGSPSAAIILKSAAQGSSRKPATKARRIGSICPATLEGPHPGKLDHLSLPTGPVSRTATTTAATHPSVKTPPAAAIPMRSPTSHSCAASPCCSIPATDLTSSGCRKKKNASPPILLRKGTHLPPFMSPKQKALPSPV